MYRLNISYKQFYVTLNEIGLYKSNPNTPSTYSEPGGGNTAYGFDVIGYQQASTNRLK